MYFTVYLNEDKLNCLHIEGDMCQYDRNSDYHVIFKKESFVTNNGDVKESFEPQALIPPGFIIVFEND